MKQVKKVKNVERKFIANIVSDLDYPVLVEELKKVTKENGKFKVIFMEEVTYIGEIGLTKHMDELRKRLNKIAEEIGFTKYKDE